MGIWPAKAEILQNSWWWQPSLSNLDHQFLPFQDGDTWDVDFPNQYHILGFISFAGNLEVANGCKIPAMDCGTKRQRYEANVHWWQQKRQIVSMVNIGFACLLASNWTLVLRDLQAVPICSLLYGRRYICVFKALCLSLDAINPHVSAAA